MKINLYGYVFLSFFSYILIFLPGMFVFFDGVNNFKDI